MKFFIFTQGLKGPEGQFLHDEQPVSGEGKPKKYLFGPEPVNDDMTLDYAILKFKDRLADA